MADSLIFCGTEFVCVLLKILDPLFMGEIPLGFHFLDHLHSLGGAWGPSHIYLGWFPPDRLLLMEASWFYELRASTADVPRTAVSTNPMYHFVKCMAVLSSETSPLTCLLLIPGLHESGSAQSRVNSRGSSAGKAYDRHLIWCHLVTPALASRRTGKCGKGCPGPRGETPAPSGDVRIAPPPSQGLLVSVPRHLCVDRWTSH